jgi:hypothetical protein
MRSFRFLIATSLSPHLVLIELLIASLQALVEIVVSVVDYAGHFVLLSLALGMAFHVGFRFRPELRGLVSVSVSIIGLKDSSISI